MTRGNYCLTELKCVHRALVSVKKNAALPHHARRVVGFLLLFRSVRRCPEKFFAESRATRASRENFL